MAERRRTKIVPWLRGGVCFMFLFGFLQVPLYDALCEALGLNGKTDGRRYRAEELVTELPGERVVRMSFLATNNAGMPWEFRPTAGAMEVQPGALEGTEFYARNPTARNMVAQAVPSISPSRAAPHLRKTECFCFSNQPLQAGEEVLMPVRFVVDSELPRDIRAITLSYTLFDVTPANAVAAAESNRES